MKQEVMASKDKQCISMESIETFRPEEGSFAGSETKRRVTY